MKKMKKIFVTFFAFAALLFANGAFACSGSYYMCDSWSDQFFQDLQNNCSGGYNVYVEWIEGC